MDGTPFHFVPDYERHHAKRGHIARYSPFWFKFCALQFDHHLRLFRVLKDQLLVLDIDADRIADLELPAE